MLIERHYKDELPPRITRLIDWIENASHFYFRDRFSDKDGTTNIVTFQLTSSRVDVTIDKANDGNITFQLEVKHD